LIAGDLTVDASVWVAAVHATDAFYEESLTLLASTRLEHVRIFVPAFADAEVACAVARRSRNSAGGRQLAQDILQAYEALRVPVDSALIEVAARIGTTVFLRGADALYAATAQITGSTLVSWDQELIQRAGAVSPTTWLDAQP
jgi:predicted nucleic acid-binding protein